MLRQDQKGSNFQKMLKTKTEIDVSAFQRGRCSPSPGFTQKPGYEKLPWGPGQEQGRIPSCDAAAGLSPDITGFVCSQGQWGSWHCWFYRGGWSLCAGMCWGPAWFIGRKNTYCIFTDFLKSSCKDVFKNLCSLSFFDHMNHHMKRSWGSSVMTLNWRKLPALRPGSHQLQGTRLCFITPHPKGCSRDEKQQLPGYCRGELISWMFSWGTF